jgi:predicted nucleic-acid-binding Zn-ribbon protein
MPETINYRCVRCGHDQCSIGSVHASGGFLSSVFNVESRKLSTVTCERCKHTEFFKADAGALATIFDLFVT